jgi:polyhydroxybutyrate depolymerase
MATRIGSFGLLISLSLVGLAGVVAACSGSDEGSKPSSEPTSSSPEAKANTPAPKDGQNDEPNADESSPTPAPDASSPPSADAQPSGCGMAPEKKGLETKVLTIGAAQRSYVQFVPKTYDATKPLALIVGFHTLGDTPEEGRAMFNLEAAAGGNAIFIYPAALRSAAFENKTRWDLSPTSADFTYVDALLQTVTANYCIDENRIFTTGFSNGGRMAALVGCRRGDAIRAIAPVAPGGGNEPIPPNSCVGNVAVWEALGDADEAHTPSGLAVRDFFVSANGCKATPTKPDGCVAYEGCGEGMGLTFCRHDGGHVWPALASAEIWKFFTAQK